MISFTGLNYCYNNYQAIFFSAAFWCRFSKEVVPSTYHKDRFDNPKEGTEWLLHFKLMNGDMVKSLDVSNLSICRHSIINLIGTRGFGSFTSAKLKIRNITC